MRRFIDPVLVVGVLCAIVCAVLSYRIAELTPAVALLAGAAVLVLALQVDLIVRVRRRQVSATRQAEVIAAVESVDDLPGLVAPIRAAVAKVDRRYGQSPAAVARTHALTECQRVLQDLERGHLAMPFDDNRLVLALTDAATKSICATSVPEIDLAFWRGPDGRRYTERLARAIERGVEVRRVFVYRDWTTELDELARTQQKAGVRVRRVHTDQLPPAMRIDVIVWDDCCSYESTTNAAGDPVTNSFTVSDDDIRVTRDRLEAIESGAEPLPTPAKSK